jgi:hypothetical protein
MNHVNHASETTSGVKPVNALNFIKLKDVSRVISEELFFSYLQ